MAVVPRPARQAASRLVADYRVFGLSVRTTLVLPCPRVPRSRRPDIALRVARSSEFARARADVGAASGRRWFCGARLQDGSRYLRWRGLFEFLISRDGRSISYRPLDHATDESLKAYLLGQVLSFSLVARGDEPLHGTVIVIDGQAIVLTGNCGRGKSTLGAAFLARGFPILSDDLVVAFERKRRWAVHPGIPRIKLFPAIARRFLEPDLAGTPMNNRTSKLVLPLRGGRTVRHAVPLKAVYVLAEPGAQPSRDPVAQIEPLSGRQAFLEVIRGAFNLLAVERERLAAQFAFATRLAGSVPIKRLTYPRRLSDLPAVCDALLADVKSEPMQQRGLRRRSGGERRPARRG